MQKETATTIERVESVVMSERGAPGQIRYEIKVNNAREDEKKRPSKTFPFPIPSQTSKAKIKVKKKITSPVPVDTPLESTPVQ